MDKKKQKVQKQEEELPEISLDSCESFDPSGDQTLSDEDSSEEEYDVD